VLVVFVVLAAGVAGLLALTTAASQDSFTLNRLQQRQSSLHDAQQALARSLLGDASPTRLARRARALGLRPAKTVRFAHKGRHHGAFAVLAAPLPKPKPQPTAHASPAPQPTMKAKTVTRSARHTRRH